MSVGKKIKIIWIIFVLDKKVFKICFLVRMSLNLIKDIDVFKKPWIDSKLIKYIYFIHKKLYSIRIVYSMVLIIFPIVNKKEK